MLIRTVLGIGAVIAIIIGIVLLTTVFGGIDLVDYITQITAGLTLVALGITYWTFKPQIDRRVANQHVEVKPKGRLISTSESHIDDIIKEIEDFIKKWREGPKIVAGYRTEIEMRRMYLNRGKIKEYSTKIRKKTKPLRGLSDSKTIPDSLETILNKMFVLGQEIESTFASNLTSSELLKIDQNKIDHLVSEGDNICRELMEVASQFERLR